MNSILRLRYSDLLASNFVIKIWDAQEKIALNVKILVKLSMVSLYEFPNQNFKI